MVRVGVLALQGDVREHARMLEDLGTSSVEVRTPSALGDIDALVIPGGESTTIGKLADRFNLLEPLKTRITSGLPTYGTCAGLILMAASVADDDQPLLGVLDVVVRRNAFGRQNDSFEAEISIEGMVDPFAGVFIRAPWVEKVGAEVEVLASVDGRPVMVRQDAMLATAFHPELGSDTRIHQRLLEMV